MHGDAMEASAHSRTDEDRCWMQIPSCKTVSDLDELFDECELWRVKKKKKKKKNEGDRITTKHTSLLNILLAILTRFREVSALAFMLCALAHRQLHLTIHALHDACRAVVSLVPLQEARLHRSTTLARHKLMHLVQVCLPLVLWHGCVAIAAIPVHSCTRQRVHCMCCNRHLVSAVVAHLKVLAFDLVSGGGESACR